MKIIKLTCVILESKLAQKQLNMKDLTHTIFNSSLFK